MTIHGDRHGPRHRLDFNVPLARLTQNLCAYTSTGAAAMVSTEAVAFFSAHVALGATFGGDRSAADG